MAVVDCGTNSIRLLVADVPESGTGALTDLTRRMEIVRLGEGVDRTGRLAAGAIARTRVALAEYAGEIRRLGADRVRMVATSATRDAANADEFAAMVLDTLAVAPEVVSGDEEARLSYAGAVRGLPAGAPPPYLVVDIGGGSTELVAGDGRVEAARSVDIGCVRITERHLWGDPPDPEQVAAAEADITAALGPALAAVAGRRPATMIGLAGSVTTVAGIALGLPAYDPARIHHARIGYEEVAKVTADLLAMPRARRLALPVMHPGRADVIGAGALILRVVMALAGTGSVLASEHDILDGVAWSFVDQPR
ncbi:MAG: exopolyphosphatase [Micromonosporaceae bacterium]|nr:exopolyphosphatase [Micromonosporaceae bacterium]